MNRKMRRRWSRWRSRRIRRWKRRRKMEKEKVVEDEETE
jgi:hypothetical protein